MAAPCQDQRRLYYLPGKRTAITECGPAETLPKIHSKIGRSKNRGTRWLHHKGIFAKRAFGHSGVKADGPDISI